jgi:hypothetical protein
MAFAIPLAMVATAVGAGIQAYGQYQQGQAQKASYNYQAGVGQQLAGALQTRANVEEAVGYQRSQIAGYRGAEEVSAQNVFEGAKGVSLTGPSATGIRASQIAKAQYGERTAVFDAAQAAYGQRFEASEKLAGAGLDVMAAREAGIAGDISAAGTAIGGLGKVVSMGAAPGGPFAPTAAGGSQAVSSKWYS